MRNPTCSAQDTTCTQSGIHVIELIKIDRGDMFVVILVQSENIFQVSHETDHNIKKTSAVSNDCHAEGCQTVKQYGW